MSRINDLRNSRGNYSVKLREFLKFRSERPNSLCCFFEGFDSQYYSVRINNIRPTVSWYGINCGGKEVVLKLFNLLFRHRSKELQLAAFFIDRDFDEHPELPLNDRVYITPGYSVENLIVTESTFFRVLFSEFNVSEFQINDHTFENCRKTFKIAFESFNESVAVLNGWIYLQRQHERTHPKTTKLNLNSVAMSKLVTIHLTKSVASYRLSDIESITGATVSFTEKDALQAIMKFPKTDWPVRFRGKFQAYFFRTFLAKLVEDATSNTSQLFKEKRRVSFNPSEKTFISILSQYAETPQTLIEFIKKM